MMRHRFEANVSLPHRQAEVMGASAMTCGNQIGRWPAAPAAAAATAVRWPAATVRWPAAAVRWPAVAAAAVEDRRVEWPIVRCVRALPCALASPNSAAHNLEKVRAACSAESVLPAAATVHLVASVAPGGEPEWFAVVSAAQPAKCRVVGTRCKRVPAVRAASACRARRAGRPPPT